MSTHRAHRPLATLRLGRELVDRARGPRRREVLGVSLRMEGANHDELDYDDAWLIGLLAGATGFIDVGSNVGFFALASCLLRPDAQVLAIDANPDCAAVTAANLVRNGFGARSRVVSAFVSDAIKDVHFQSVGLGAAGSGVDGLAESAIAVDASMIVRSDTLDAIVAQTAFVADLVKIDVEGAERAVLRGATRTVAEQAPTILVEMHSGASLAMTQNAADVLAWCDEVGYRAWYLTTGEPLEAPAAVAHRGRCHLLLQPRNLPYPAILRGVPESAPIDLILDRLQAERH